MTSEKHDPRKGTGICEIGRRGDAEVWDYLFLGMSSKSSPSSNSQPRRHYRLTQSKLLVLPLP